MTKLLAIKPLWSLYKAAALKALAPAVMIVMLCSAGRAQSTPAVSITYPGDNMAFNGNAYIGVQTNISGFATVTDAVATFFDNAGHSFPVTLSGDGKAVSATEACLAPRN